MAGNLTAMIASIFSGGVTADPYYEYTTLLLPGNGTNGAQNNTFLDSSTNNFNITRNGNTTQGTFSPFSQTGWGNYFDGTSDYLTVNDNAALELGSSNFCLEFMYYPTSPANTDFVTKRVNAASYGLIIIQSGLALNFWLSSSGSSWDLFSNVALGSVTLNAWNHLAIYRIGNAWYSSLNGTITTLSASLSGSVLNNAANWNIGGNNYNSGSVIGYLSNFRLVIGSSVYTSTSAPIPTAPLTAVTNTQLLTCQSSRFVDNSTNNFAVTPTGNTTVVPFSPFNPTASWSAATNGGSGYFDGNGDYLSVAHNAAFNLGSNDWCIEFFVYKLNSTTATLVTKRPNNGVAAYPNIFANASNQIGIELGGTTFTTASSLTLNAWTHIAVVKNGSGSANVKCYINGTADANTGTLSSAITSNTNALVLAGDTNGNQMTGYMSNFRMVNGSPVYTANFTPPTAPLTAITNTSLLLNFTNAGIYDATSKNDLETVGNAQISTAISAKWGSGVMAFDGSTSYLRTPTSALYSQYAGDFTIEFWIYPANTSAGSRGVVSTGYSANGLHVSQQGANLVFYIGTTGLVATSVLTANTWQHIACVRNGTTVTIYKDGTSVASGTNSTSNSTINFLIVGSSAHALTEYFNGYLQDVRITNGIARYTANFTAPTAAFPTL